MAPIYSCYTTKSQGHEIRKPLTRIKSFCPGEVSFLSVQVKLQIKVPGGLDSLCLEVSNIKVLFCP